MKLSPRRFPDTIARLRGSPTERNSAGEYTAGAVVETAFRASVQPLALTDADIAGGVQLSESFKVYIPSPDALVAAVDDSVADRVLWNSKIFSVVESRSWAGSHTRATILRAT